MIKKGLKNYFINLKYYFTPLGVFALAVLIGLAIAVPFIVGSIRGLVDYVTSIDNVHLDFSAFLHKILDALLALDWRNPSKALVTAISADWLNETFADSIFALVSGVEPVAEQILEKINACVSSIVSAFFIVIVFALIGIVGGFFLTKSLIRKEIAKRSFWKAFLVFFIDIVITAAFPLLSVYLSSLWSPSVYLIVILIPILWGVILLFEAHIVHGMGKVKMKEVVSSKNAAKLILVNLLILLIASAFTSIVSAVAGELLGLLLGVPFLEIGFIVCGLNAEAYVKEVADNAQAAKKTEQA